MAGGCADGTQVVIKTQGHARERERGAGVVHRLMSLGGRGEQWPFLTTRQSPSPHTVPHSVKNLCRICDIHSGVDADTNIVSIG